MAAFDVIICVSEVWFIKWHVKRLRHRAFYVPGAVLEFLNSRFLGDGLFRQSTIDVMSVEILARIAHSCHLGSGCLEAISTLVYDWQRHQIFAIRHREVEGIHFTTDDYLNINFFIVHETRDCVEVILHCSSAQLTPQAQLRVPAHSPKTVSQMNDADVLLLMTSSTPAQGSLQLNSVDLPSHPTLDLTALHLDSAPLAPLCPGARLQSTSPLHQPLPISHYEWSLIADWFSSRSSRVAYSVFLHKSSPRATPDCSTASRGTRGPGLWQ